MPYNKLAEEKGIENEWQKPFPWDDKLKTALSQVFEIHSYRENQKEIINATLSKRDVIALIPTGGGKSLTFQLPSILTNQVTFVIMPLLSLIEDNHSFVTNLGIPAL